jgi:transposase
VKGSISVGVDRNETNFLVAVKEKGEVFFDSGLNLRVWRKKHRKKVARLQKKLAERKAQHKDTRSVRRLLKRLSLCQRNFTKTYCQTVAKRFIAWAGRTLRAASSVPPLVVRPIVPYCRVPSRKVLERFSC